MTLIVRRGDILTAAEVAILFHVHTKTVGHWAEQGLLPYFRTPGGHRRYRLEDVEALLNAGRSQ